MQCLMQPQSGQLQHAACSMHIAACSLQPPAHKEHVSVAALQLRKEGRVQDGLNLPPELEVCNVGGCRRGARRVAQGWHRSTGVGGRGAWSTALPASLPASGQVVRPPVCSTTAPAAAACKHLCNPAAPAGCMHAHRMDPRRRRLCGHPHSTQPSAPPQRARWRVHTASACAPATLSGCSRAEAGRQQGRRTVLCQSKHCVSRSKPSNCT
jgi:hypothetical protein